MYTLMWIPRSGLFWANGQMMDGEFRAVQWDRKIRVYPNYQRAELAKKRILDRFPNAKGELIILTCEVEERD